MEEKTANLDCPLTKPLGRPIKYEKEEDRLNAMKESKRKYYANNKDKFKKYNQALKDKNPKYQEENHKKYKFSGYYMITDGKTFDIRFSRSMYFRTNDVIRTIKAGTQKKFPKEKDWKIKFLDYSIEPSKTTHDKHIEEALGNGLLHN